MVLVVRIPPPLGLSIRVGPPRTPRRDSRTHVRVLAPAVVTNAGVPARIDEQLLDPFRIEASAEKLCGRGPRWMLQTGSHGARAGVPVQALTSSVFQALPNKTPHVRVARCNFRPPVADGAPVDDVVFQVQFVKPRRQHLSSVQRNLPPANFVKQADPRWPSRSASRRSGRAGRGRGLSGRTCIARFR